MVWDRKPVCPNCKHYHRDYHPEEPEDSKEYILQCMNCNKVFKAVCYVSYEYKTAVMEMA